MKLLVALVVGLASIHSSWGQNTGQECAAAADVTAYTGHVYGKFNESTLLGKLSTKCRKCFTAVNTSEASCFLAVKAGQCTAAEATVVQAYKHGNESQPPQVKQGCLLCATLVLDPAEDQCDKAAQCTSHFSNACCLAKADCKKCYVAGLAKAAATCKPAASPPSPPATSAAVVAGARGWWCHAALALAAFASHVC